METVRQCPKCGYKSETPFAECPGCGVIVAKFLGIEHSGPVSVNPENEPDRQAQQNSFAFYKSAFILLILLAIVGWWGWTRIAKKSVPVMTGFHGTSEKISNGEKVEIDEHLAEGGYTVFVFYADW